MEQVEELCDYIALINRGKVMIEDDINRVRKQFQKNIYHVDFEGDYSHLEQLPGVSWKELSETHAQLELPDGRSNKEILYALAALPVDIRRFEHHLPRLNDIFIELVGQTDEEPASAITAE